MAYEIWRKGTKNAPEIDVYMPIGKIAAIDMTDDELDEVWQKYGKLERGKKLRKLINLRRN